jgi:hypothetical protein
MKDIYRCIESYSDCYFFFFTFQPLSAGLCSSTHLLVVDMEPSPSVTIADVSGSASMDLDFSTFLSMFSILVIFYYIWKFIRRKALIFRQSTDQDENADSKKIQFLEKTPFSTSLNSGTLKTESSGSSSVSESHSKENNFQSPPIRTRYTDALTKGKNTKFEDRHDGNQMSPSLSPQRSSATEVKQRKKKYNTGYGLVDHSVSTIKKKRRSVDEGIVTRSKAKEIYCQMNVPTSLKGDTATIESQD